MSPRSRARRVGLTAEHVPPGTVEAGIDRRTPSLASILIRADRKAGGALPKNGSIGMVVGVTEAGEGFAKSSSSKCKVAASG